MHPANFQCPTFERGPELGPETGDDPVTKLVETWKGATVPREDIIGDILEKRDNGELTGQQAQEAAIQLGLISQDPTN